VPVEEEIRRVVPVIEALAPEIPVPISVDTSKPEVMRAAVEAGAGMINDVYALRQEGALEAVAPLSVPVCLMHMQGEPRTMQRSPRYDDVLQDVATFLREQVARSVDAGIARERLLLDPGFGFGKTLEHNLSLLKHLNVLAEEGLPVLVGMSRKSMIGTILDEPVDKRLFGSIAVATLAAWQGARVIRAHDVKATVDAVRMADAVATAF
jgi:dihydropteroate synthase